MMSKQTEKVIVNGIIKERKMYKSKEQKRKEAEERAANNATNPGDKISKAEDKSLLDGKNRSKEIERNKKKLQTPKKVKN